MRVSGGTGKGKRLKVPPGDRVRPTSDKVKQALFNILGEAVRNAAVLDLYAGTGNVGIEALSRGASRAVFVDDARTSLQVIRRNVESAGFSGQAQVVASKADSYVRKAGERFDIVFLDPPYTTDILPVLMQISGSELIGHHAVVVAEHVKKQPSPRQAGRLRLYREAVYGDTVLAFYRQETSGQEEQQ